MGDRRWKILGDGNNGIFRIDFSVQIGKRFFIEKDKVLAPGGYYIPFRRVRVVLDGPFSEK
jgi:hypothetical protein